MAASSGADAQSSQATRAGAVPGSKPPLFPDNAQFWYETLRGFGAANYGGSEFGEVLVTASRITAGDVDSWYEAWHDITQRIAKEAGEQLEHGHRISARDSFFRAATYYRASEFFLHGNPQDSRIGNAYRKTVECYLSSARLFDPPIEPMEIPYEHTTLPSYLHRVDNSNTRRPLVIIHTGFDGSAEEMHVQGARAAVERGYNVLAFDGPEQFGPLHREGLHFRPDWEKVVTPVVDFALKLPGVDPKRIALMRYMTPASCARLPGFQRGRPRHCLNHVIPCKRNHDGIDGMMPVIGSRLSSAFAWFGGNNIAQNLLEAPVPAKGCGYGSGRSEDDLPLAAILR